MHQKKLFSQLNTIYQTIYLTAEVLKELPCVCLTLTKPSPFFSLRLRYLLV